MWYISVDNVVHLCGQCGTNFILYCPSNKLFAFLFVRIAAIWGKYRIVEPQLFSCGHPTLEDVFFLTIESFVCYYFNLKRMWKTNV